MTSTIASAAFALLILGIFWLDRDPRVRTSKAIWISVIWWFLACSRSVGQWLEVNTSMGSLTPEMMEEGSPVDRLVYGGLAALGVIVLVKRSGLVLKLLRTNGPIILFFFYYGVSISWSGYPDVAFKRWIKALGDLVMILVVLTDREPYAAFERLLSRTTYLLVPLSVLLIKYYPALGRGIHKWTYKTFYTGAALNKNVLGMICLLGGLTTVWRLLTAFQDRRDPTRTRRLFAQSVILTMVLWLFWMANSMTSLSCFMIGTAILLAGNVFAFIRNNPAVMHVFIAAILLVTGSVLFFNVSPDALDAMGKDPTLTDRTNVWALLVSVGESPLVGTGYESFWLGSRLHKIWNVYTWKPFSSHNGYLEIYLNLGWMGVALLALVIATSYRKVVAAFRLNHRVGSFVLACFSVGLVYNFTEAAFFRMMTPVWMFFLLAITGPVVLVKYESESVLGQDRKFDQAPNMSPAPILR